MAKIHTILQGFVDLNLERDENSFTTITNPPNPHFPNLSGLTTLPGGITGLINPLSSGTTTNSGSTPFSGVVPSGFTAPPGNLLV